MILGIYQFRIVIIFVHETIIKVHKKYNVLHKLIRIDLRNMVLKDNGCNYLFTVVGKLLLIFIDIHKKIKRFFKRFCKII